MSVDQVSKRLAGVPVYTVSNASNEFVLVSDMTSQKSLGIFCFRQEDAQALLLQVKDREPSLGRGARIVAVSLDKVYKLNAEGISFRFLPDPLQIKNALEVRAKVGSGSRDFDGVPLFQASSIQTISSSEATIADTAPSSSARMHNTSSWVSGAAFVDLQEDLEQALLRAFKQQKRTNPSMRVNTDIQVGSFEDVLKRMEGNEEDSGWGDIVFIPPGMDAYQQIKTVAEASGSRSTVIA
eukprot:SM000019S04978  [mRNA]  locus=s19:297433:299894:+ [translate_table: standard]